jgi:hypothetical protein
MKDANAELELWTLLSTEIWYQDVYCRRDRAAANAHAVPMTATAFTG